LQESTNLLRLITDSLARRLHHQIADLPPYNNDAQPDTPNTMHCHDLASQIERLEPRARPRDVARVCLLLTNHVRNFQDLADEQRLAQAWQEMSLRLQAAADQHAAMSSELDDLARSNPNEFTANEIATLLRAIKVQSQVLQLYVGLPA
jgi:hypothetical protein